MDVTNFLSKLNKTTILYVVALQKRFQIYRFTLSRGLLSAKIDSKLKN